ncbi:Maf-like protein [Desertivirga brevis]|uniref:Maf-like protein n=1 Tax=Desertivirga brevis TaxID=2810310 RepID=UPI001A970909|nr:Maf-like protein [Pedobacter sp. SYSU D00873]
MKTLPGIILASKSPRRQELLSKTGIEFDVVLKDVDESYPEGLSPKEVAIYIAEKKAKAFDETLEENAIVLTADTIVSIDNKILGKPENEDEAMEMLSLLSGRKHDVITGVALLQNHQIFSFAETTEVYFLPLSPDEIKYYIQTYQPFDKAGAYGIQEWIGLAGIERINGSYSNVVGLPTHRVYEELQKLVKN